MPSPACRSQTLVQQHESCRPRRPAPSPRVPRSRDGSSVRPRRDPRRTDGRCPAPALTRGRVARGGGTKRGGGPLIASGGPPSRGGGLPPCVCRPLVPPMAMWATVWGVFAGMAAAAGWRAVCRLWAWRWAGGGLGPASRPSSGDLGRHPGRAVSGPRRPRPAAASRAARPYAVPRRTRRRGAPGLTVWGRRRAGSACACCAR